MSALTGPLSCATHSSKMGTFCCTTSATRTSGGVGGGGASFFSHPLNRSMNVADRQATESIRLTMFLLGNGWDPETAELRFGRTAEQVKPTCITHSSNQRLSMLTTLAMTGTSTF